MPGGSAFEAAGVPWGPIRALDEVFADEQVRHRGILQAVQHPGFGSIPQVRNPMVTGEEAAQSAPPPLLGEHTDSILRQLGLSPDEIESLRACGAVA